MRVVEVKASDVDIIEQVYQNEIESFGIMGGADRWLIKSFVRYGKMYVLMDENRLLSVAQFQRVFYEKSVFLYGFSTVVNERNKGYGKELLRKVEKKLRDEKIEKIYLTVDPQNDIAMKIYTNEGYKIVEFEKDEYGKGIDRYLMMKNI